MNACKVIQGESRWCIKGMPNPREVGVYYFREVPQVKSKITCSCAHTGNQERFVVTSVEYLGSNATEDMPSCDAILVVRSCGEYE